MTWRTAFLFSWPLGLLTGAIELADSKSIARFAVIAVLLTGALTWFTYYSHPLVKKLGGGLVHGDGDDDKPKSDSPPDLDKG